MINLKELNFTKRLLDNKVELTIFVKDAKVALSRREFINDNEADKFYDGFVAGIKASQEL